MTKTQYTEELDLLEIDDTEQGYNLIVYNDEVNTFEHVIDTLIKVCKHNSIQAEQCTLLIHNTGKCKVKNGELDELEAMCTKICKKGISAEVV